MGNATNTQCTDHSLPESWLVAVASLAFYSTLGALGLFGNVNVILVFASSRERSLRFLVIVLSCTDLAICSVILPTDCYRVFTDYLASQSVTPGRRPINHWASALILSSRYAAFEMEAWILVLIAVDRYLCIVRARRRGLAMPKTLAALAAGAGFLVAVESANVIGHYLIEDRCRLKLLVETQVLRLYGALGTASVLTVAALYARIFTFVALLQRRKSSRRAETERTLRALSKPADAAGGGGDGGCDAASALCEPPATSHAPAAADGAAPWFPRKLALMLFAASVLFYASMLPMILINFKLLPDSPLHRFFYVNTALNFFVYAIVNDKFREELARLYGNCGTCGTCRSQ